jgi:hypothetical protein
MCLWNLLERKQWVPMMLVEVSVNLHYFGFHRKDISYYFNNCKFLHAGFGGATLEYISKHQTQVRADLYRGLCDSLMDGETRGAHTGK